MKNLLVIPGQDFTQAYAGTAYLLGELARRGCLLRILMRCDEQAARRMRDLPFRLEIWPYRSQGDRAARKMVSAVFKAYIFFLALRARHILTTESNYLAPLAWARRLNRRGILVQYCQELLTPEDYPHSRLAHTYAKYARVPDIVIDVDPCRAAARRQRFALRREPLVLLNTMPASRVAAPAPAGTLARLAGAPLPKGLPVLLHAGGIGKEKPLSRVIDAVAICRSPVFLLAFCTGDESEIRRVAEYAREKLETRPHCIRDAVPRQQLWPALHEADIGVVDYTFSVEPTLNQKYCAPTKLFEFMAHGVAILGSNNDSLRRIVEGENIGRCADADSVESLAAALESLVSDRAVLAEMKQRGPIVFGEKYSYEKACSPVVSRLMTLLQTQRE